MESSRQHSVFIFIMQYKLCLSKHVFSVGESNSGDGSNLLQSLGGLPVPAEEETHVSPSSALDAQVRDKPV